jgi:peptidoglycan/LPS O-acetylase OafA/YrhL
MTRSRELTDLTSCRALFALWVFAYHVNLQVGYAHWLGPFAPVVEHGYLGVDGFFILSGLILARVDADTPFTLRGAMRFWGKRLARIYPVHIAVIALLGALFLAGVAAGITPREPARFAGFALLCHLALVQGWGTLDHWAWNYPSWSISSEWAGYLLFPLMIASYRVFDKAAFAISLPLCFCVLAMIASLYGGLNLTFGTSLFRFFPEFIAGMATTALVPFIADEAPNRAIAIVGAAVAVAFAATGHDAMCVLGLWLMLYGLAMQGDAERPASIGAIRPLRVMGVISYAFYMSFAPAELVTTQFFRHLGIPRSGAPLEVAFMLAALTLGLAIVLHVLIEKPARIILNRRFDPSRAAALAEGSVAL